MDQFFGLTASFTSFCPPPDGDVATVGYRLESVYLKRTSTSPRTHALGARAEVSHRRAASYRVAQRTDFGRYRAL